jgi:SAM-dependent methyltransferase
MYVSEVAFDVRHRVRTRGILKHEKVGAFTDAFRYEATPRWRIKKSLGAVPVDPQRFAFVDLGCGRGLVLLLAARRGFRRIIGVELSHDLAEVARANAASYRGRGADTSRIDVVEADATTWEPPQEPVVIYIYNSFARPGFERLARTIGDSLRAHPREMYVVYMFPESRGALDHLDVLKVIEDDPRYVIYRSAVSAGVTVAGSLR